MIATSIVSAMFFDEKLTELAATTQMNSTPTRAPELVRRRSSKKKQPRPMVISTVWMMPYCTMQATQKSSMP